MSTVDQILTALAEARPGATCSVAGFEMWKAAEFGWQNADTGQLVSSGYLAAILHEANPNVLEDAAAMSPTNSTCPRCDYRAVMDGEHQLCPVCHIDDVASRLTPDTEPEAAHS
jgi:hypothetical protein